MPNALPSSLRESLIWIARETLIASVLLTVVIGLILWQAGAVSLAVRYAIPLSVGAALLVTCITAYASRDQKMLNTNVIGLAGLLGVVLLGVSVAGIWGKSWVPRY
jgi:hypothetical protein